MRPASLREPNWDAVRRADPWAPARYGWGGHIVHMAHPKAGVMASVCTKKRCTLSINNWSFVTCALCLSRLPIAGHLNDGTPVFEVRHS